MNRLMNNKKKSKIKRFLKNKFWQLAIVCLIFPLIVGAIYMLPLPQIIAVDAGDLLAFYGAAFGILGSFYVYLDEKKKAKKEIDNKLRPKLVIEVNKHSNVKNLFDIRILNQSEKSLSYFSLYDEFISPDFPKKKKLTVSYNLTVEEHRKLKSDFNITSDEDILDDDGYPKYIQVVCDDAEHRAWVGEFFKINDGNKIFYYPRDWEVM